MRVKLSSLPAAAKSYCVSLERLDGGLNLFEEESRLAANQSSEMKNLVWRDGALASRHGQRLLCSAEGEGLAAYERFFAGKAIFHIGSCLYAVNPANGEKSCLWRELDNVAGSFFLYGGRLYYKTRGAYLCIDENLNCSSVEAYTPVTYINADPLTGAGDAYQPENRLSAKKTIWYNASGGLEYHLPVTGAEIVEVSVNGQAADYTADSARGVVKFSSAPAVSDPPVNNTVRITYLLENSEAYNSVMDCRFAQVFGGEAQLCVVMAGASAQPDAYFWNGAHTAMDPGYFPMEQYNLANGEISGFGRQQGVLIIFGRNSVGRAAMSFVEIDGRERIQMPYLQINSAIGCDMPESICLVENNLIFCNSGGGVYRLQSSSAAGENELLHISRNIDGTAQRPGLLNDAALCPPCAAVDDGSCYWLALGGRAYLWDHSISTPAAPSWFLLTNVEAAAFVREGSEMCYVSPNGRVCAFTEGFADFGEGIEREYKFPSQSFGGYERLKTIDKIVLTVSSTTDSLVHLEYISDYGLRTEPVPVQAFSWRLSPRSLNYRMLSCMRWSKSAVRRPACRNVRHFSMRLYNCAAGQDLSILSAKIFFRFRAQDR